MDRPSFNSEHMRTRLREAIAASGRTQKDITSSARLGHGYLTNILARNQMPSVDKLDAICQELNVSVAWVMYGVDLPPDYQEVFDAMERNPKKFRALMHLLE
jgi:transcriptional regulator with XRE-family HTH domain